MPTGGEVISHPLPGKCGDYSRFPTRANSLDCHEKLSPLLPHSTDETARRWQWDRWTLACFFPSSLQGCSWALGLPNNTAWRQCKSCRHCELVTPFSLRTWRHWCLIGMLASMPVWHHGVRWGHMNHVVLGFIKTLKATYILGCTLTKSWSIKMVWEEPASLNTASKRSRNTGNYLSCEQWVYPQHEQ